MGTPHHPRTTSSPAGVAEVAASGIQGASGNGTGCPEAGEAESPPGAGAGTGPPDSVAGELSPQLGVEAQALL